MTGAALTGIATEVLGWVGCILLIVSILQRRIVVLRALSLVSSLILTAYNLVHGVWPMVAMNAAIVVINAIYLSPAREGVGASGALRDGSVEIGVSQQGPVRHQR
jgi:hypothetical protein